MSVTNRLVFDPAEIANAADGGSNVGSYVRAGTDGTLIGHTGDALNVAVTGVDFSYDYAEDAAHSDGDIGAYVLAVRQDTLSSSTSADGDYASFKVDAAGALYINGSQYTQPISATDLDIRDLTHVSDSVKVGDGTDFLAVNGDGSINAVVTATDLDIRDLSQATDSVSAWMFDGTGDAIESLNSHMLVSDVANSGILASATAVSTTAVNVVASALSNRTYLGLANEGNKMLYFGQTGVSTSTGFPLPPGGQQVWRIGPALTPQIIGEAGSSSEDLRVLELA